VTDFFAYDGAAEPPTQPATSALSAAARPVLADLADEDWEALIRFAARRRHASGAVVIEAGERGAALHFIAAGEVRLRAPGQPGVPEQRRGEGELIGMVGFLDGAPSPVQAVAVGEVELLRLDRTGFDRLAAWQPRIALMLLRDLGAQIAARLRALQPAD
jgi:CRP-like cAMP-binding protein